MQRKDLLVTYNQAEAFYLFHLLKNSQIEAFIEDCPSSLQSYQPALVKYILKVEAHNFDRANEIIHSPANQFENTESSPIRAPENILKRLTRLETLTSALSIVCYIGSFLFLFLVISEPNLFCLTYTLSGIVSFILGHSLNHLTCLSRTFRESCLKPKNHQNEA